MPQPLRAAIYLRVSSEEQALEGVSLDAQEHECRAACAAHGWQVADVLRDEGFSAFSRKPRPAFIALQARLAEWDMVVVWRMDRFARRTREMHNVVGEMLDRGVAIHSCREAHLDLTTPAGRLMFGVAASLAQYEPEVIQERVRSGMEQVVRSGRKLGFAPYGYRSIGPKLGIEPDPATAPTVQRIFRDYAGGLHIADIQRGLYADGIPSPRGNALWRETTIRNLLRREAYLGLVVHRRSGTVQPGLHEAIIDRATWETCQRRIAANRYTPAKSRASTLYPLVACAECGERLYTIKSRGMRSYFCKRANVFGSHAPITITERNLMEHIWQLAEWLLSPEVVAAQEALQRQAPARRDRRADKLRREQQVLEDALRYTLEAARAANLPPRVYAQQTEEQRKRLEEIERELRTLAPVETRPTVPSLRSQLAAVQSAGADRQREFLRCLLAEVRVGREEIAFALVTGDTVRVQRVMGRRLGLAGEPEWAG